MCGIAGISLRPGEQIGAATLAALAAALAHRGPDGAGDFVTPETALIHTRLAIIDLATGDQPLRAGPLTLIANGEIYNYRELRAALPLPCATQSDCEPPLHLFARRADGYADALRGMYAIAIHDQAFQTLTLSRDPFGIKPLYTAQTPLGLAFASEPQALLGAGLAARTLDRARAHRAAAAAIHHWQTHYLHWHHPRRAGRDIDHPRRRDHRDPDQPCLGRCAIIASGERGRRHRRPRRGAGKRRRPAPAC